MGLWGGYTLAGLIDRGRGLRSRVQFQTAARYTPSTIADAPALDRSLAVASQTEIASWLNDYGKYGRAGVASPEVARQWEVDAERDAIAAVAPTAYAARGMVFRDNAVTVAGQADDGIRTTAIESAFRGAAAGVASGVSGVFGAIGTGYLVAGLAGLAFTGFVVYRVIAG